LTISTIKQPCLFRDVSDVSVVEAHPEIRVFQAFHALQVLQSLDLDRKSRPQREHIDFGFWILDFGLGRNPVATAPGSDKNEPPVSSLFGARVFTDI
jgi:hypothetical protein